MTTCIHLEGLNHKSMFCFEIPVVESDQIHTPRTIPIAKQSEQGVNFIVTESCKVQYHIHSALIQTKPWKYHAT